MKNYDILFEELTDAQKLYTDTILKGEDYNSSEAHRKMFDSYPDRKHHDRIIFDNKNENFNMPLEIIQHLYKNGYDYDSDRDMAVKKFKDINGNDKFQYTSVGKVLQKTNADKITANKLTSSGKRQSLMSLHSTSKSNNEPTQLVISRDKYDIAGMSTDRHWQSCMTLPHGKNISGCNHHYIASDLKNHTLIAYLTKKGDDNIEKPLGRVLIKKYVSDKHPPIYRVIGKGYGNFPNAEIDRVSSIIKKHYPSESGVEYNKVSSDYNEGPSDILERKGLYKSSNGTYHYNQNAQLHDYIDDQGRHKPAYVYGGCYSHHKNDILHREGDKPARLIDYGNGDIEYEYYKNGILHRDADKPTTYTRNIDRNVTMKYIKYGMLHRDGDKPTVLEYHQNGIKANEQYHKFDILHREGDKPAIITYDDKGKVMGYEHYKNGILHRDGNLPTVLRHDSKGVKLEESYYKNGEFHREGDEPAQYIINKRHGGTESIIRRAKNGIEYHSHLPSYESYEHDSDGNLKDSEIRYTDSNGDYHRDGDEPAIIRKFKVGDDNIKEQVYYKNGLNHRDNDQPSEYRIADSSEETRTSKKWKINGNYGRVNGIYDEEHDSLNKTNGEVINQKICHNISKLDKDTPSMIIVKKDKNGNVISTNKLYKQHPIYHNEFEDENFIKIDKDGLNSTYNKKTGKTVYKDVHGNEYSDEGIKTPYGVKIHKENGKLYITSAEYNKYEVKNNEVYIDGKLIDEPDRSLINAYRDFIVNKRYIMPDSHRHILDRLKDEFK